MAKKKTKTNGNSNSKKKKTLTKREKLAIFKNATIINNFIFIMLMRRKKFGKTILEIILGEKIEKINIIEYEKNIDVKHTQKSVRMDIYLEGGKGQYNIEMQVENRYNIVMRARYYSSMLDLNSLEKSKDYQMLPESFIIFICLFDPFKLNQAKYVFNYKCELEDGTHIKMGDKSNIIFLNAPAYMNAKNDDLRYFLEYIATQVPKNALMKAVDKEIKAIKADQQMEGEFMVFATNYMDDMRTLEEENTELVSVIVEKEQVIAVKDQVIVEKDQVIEEKDQVIEEKDQALKAEQEARRQEQEVLKAEQEARRQELIILLKKFDDGTVSEIRGLTVEEVAELRVKLLGW